MKDETHFKHIDAPLPAVFLNHPDIVLPRATSKIDASQLTPLGDEPCMFFTINVGKRTDNSDATYDGCVGKIISQDTELNLLSELIAGRGSKPIPVQGLVRYTAKVTKDTSSGILVARCLQEIPTEDIDNPQELFKQREDFIRFIRKYCNFNFPTTTIFNLLRMVISENVDDSNIRYKIMSASTISEQISLVCEHIKQFPRKMPSKPAAGLHPALLNDSVRSRKMPSKPAAGLPPKGRNMTPRQRMEKRIEEANLPEEIRRVAWQEVEQMGGGSIEDRKTATYLNHLLALPWMKSSKVSIDIKKSRQMLENSHYGMEASKSRIIEYLAVQKRVGKGRSPILCLVGPPGIGKTTLARSIAESIGRSYIRISLGGINDEAEIRGHSRAYTSAVPGRIIRELQKAGVNNPLILLDEIDKIEQGRNNHGAVEAALLEVLDPEQNSSFYDNYMEVGFDLSNVMFVATANTEDIHGPLKDRMEVIYLSSYTELDKISIAEKHLVPDNIEQCGLKTGEVKFDRSALIHIIRHHTREAGVRELNRQIWSICRKIVLAQEENPGRSDLSEINITDKSVKDYLGTDKITFNNIIDDNTDTVGIANGLAWTAFGGNLLIVESVVLPGRGGIIRTGKLGDMIKESVETALTNVKIHMENYGAESDSLTKRDIHVHFPSGAIPKDGPSAGVTIATSLMSSVTKTPVRRDIAMTGEITLTGKVLPVGGIKEKVIAAARGGVREVLLPAANKNDVEEIPKEVREAVKITFVEKIDEVFQAALIRSAPPS